MLHDEFSGAPREGDHGGECGGFVADDDGAGGLQGEVGARPAHPGGQPETPLRHGLAEVISSFRDLRAAARLAAVD